MPQRNSFVGKKSNTLTIRCTCGNLVSRLKVTGDGPRGEVVESHSCWRCKHKQGYSMSKAIGEDVNRRKMNGVFLK